jgi:hypothetical protein
MQILSFGDGWDVEKARAEELERRASGLEEEDVDALLVELENADYLTIVRG